MLHDAIWRYKRISDVSISERNFESRNLGYLLTKSERTVQNWVYEPRMIIYSNPCLNLHPPSVLKTPCKFCGIFLSRSFTRFFHNGSNHWRSSPFLAHLLRNWTPQGWIAVENHDVKIYYRCLPSRIFWKAAQPSYLLSRTQLLTFQLLAMFNSKPGLGRKLILYLVPKLIIVVNMANATWVI